MTLPKPTPLLGTLLTLGTLCVALPGCLVTALPPGGPVLVTTPSLTIHVLSATYGGRACGAPPGNHTQPIASECNGRADCEYLVNNRYGDPAPGCGKDFLVEYRCGENKDVFLAEHGAQYNENYAVRLTCGPAPAQKTISIEAGSYGPVCGTPAGNHTDFLASECQGRTHCDFLVNNRYGDPAPGCPKDYIAEWRCGANPTLLRTGHHAVPGENYTIALACPQE